MAAPSRTITVALVGNPNCGKTTLFNALTGARQQVGNWPGVTVERVEGTYRHRDAEFRVVDLPGIYSFAAHSLDERISRDYLLAERPDVVINIVDATNLERNLYLTLQLLEMRVPVVVALNMTDLLKSRGIAVDAGHLEEHLGCRVIPAVASRKQGIDAIRDAVAEAAQRGTSAPFRALYDSEVEEAIETIQPAVSVPARRAGVDPRWMAVKLLERDATAERLAAGAAQELVAGEIGRLERHTGQTIDLVMADGRYGAIHGLARDVIRRDEPTRRTVSDAMDRLVLNRVVGIPLFLAVMYGVFLATFRVGGPFIDLFGEATRALLVDGVRDLLRPLQVPPLLVTLLADGVGGGIRTVTALLPPVFFIFAFLSVLEDSGYMARAAFLMDHLLRRVGLPGKAFVPLLVGFGCNVPAILATRTLDEERDRLMTILINPFMSCGARFPVYTVLAAAFFPRHGTLVVFGLYAAGIVLALLTALALGRTVLRGEPSTFVMELPPYHVPTLGGILHHTWHRLRGFIVRAGKIIVLFSAALSLLNGVALDGRVAPGLGGDSLLGGIGRGLAPVFRPMGIERDNWPAVVGLFSGVFAKEAVVGTLDALYTQTASPAQGSVSAASGGVPATASAAWAALRERLSAAAGAFVRGFAPRSAQAGSEETHVSVTTFAEMREHFRDRVSAFAYMLFVLIYVPCMATIAAIYREAGPRWTVFSVAYLTGLAWVVSTAFYQAATLARHPASSGAWVGACLGAVALFYLGLHAKARRTREAS